MSMVLYLMCLAISGMTGWPIHLLIVLAGIATVIYTFFGGIEGVVWTDVTQGTLLVVGGLLSLGYLLFAAPVSAMEVLTTAHAAGKFNLAVFEFSWDQVSIWILLVFGFNLYMTRYGTDQTVVQRYLLAPSTREASRALWLSVACLSLRKRSTWVSSTWIWPDRCQASNPSEMLIRTTIAMTPSTSGITTGGDRRRATW